MLGPLFKLLEATFELLVPIVVGLIVDKGLGEGVYSGGKLTYPNANKGFIFAMCGVLGGFAVVGFICAVVAQYFAARAATGVASDVRKALFKKMQTLSYSDYDELGVSAMITRMTGDVNQFQSGVNLFLRLFLRSPFIVFGAMIAAFFIDRKVALVFVAAIAALSVVVFAIMFATMPLHKRSQDRLDDVLLSTRENLSGARVIRAFCAEEEEKKVFSRRNAALTESRTFADAIGALMNPLTYVLVNGAIILLIYKGAIRVDHGFLSQGNVLALYNLMSQILVELVKLANLIVTVAKAAACGNRIESVLEKQSALAFPTSSNAPLAQSEPFIRFDGVGIRYNEKADFALSDVSFSVNRGEVIGIIGGTGSGKTTLVNLLPRFYEATEGQVFLDGKPVDSYEKLDLRSRFGIAPQKAVLFSGTIAENLRWGNENATDEELWDALKTAQAEDVVKQKGGLSALVEQGGKNFSGGQRQRLTIARALVRKPDVLVLDDSSSALDYATDAALKKAIVRLPYRPTVFVVAQRTSAIAHADKIVALEDGKVAGIGTHETLLSTCSVYREIYESQYGEANA